MINSNKICRKYRIIIIVYINQLNIYAYIKELMRFIKKNKILLHRYIVLTIIN